MRARLRIVAIVVLAGVFLFSGYQIVRNYIDDMTYTEQFRKLVQELPAPPPPAPGETPLTEWEIKLLEYEALHAKNGDFAGWLSIEGTPLSYPVMYAPDRVDYYLRRSFDKGYSEYGVPYIAEACDPEKPSDNIVIYGHHIKNGKMFGSLAEYTSQAYYEAHKMIRFDTLTEQGDYEIVAVFKTTVYDDGGFKYYKFADAADASEFDAFISQCKALSFYDTGVSAAPGDKLITLSTCEYTAKNGRLVVVAKKVEPHTPISQK